jgi:hypothetical protein
MSVLMRFLRLPVNFQNTKITYFNKKIKFHKLNFKLIQQKKYEGANLSFETS